MPSSATSRSLPKGSLRSHCDHTTQPDRSGEQVGLFDRDPKTRASDGTRDIYAAFRAAMEAAGGLDWLVATLDREPSYGSRISDALGRRDHRYLIADWFVPLLHDAQGAAILLAALANMAGYEPPKPKRVATRDELLSALLDEIEDAGGVGAALKERAAKRIGTDSGAFRK